MLRLKLNNLADNKSMVVSIDATISLLQLQTDHIQAISNLPPCNQQISVRGLGQVVQGAADSALTLRHFGLSSGDIIQISRTSTSTTTAPSTWACQVCTLINTATNANCQACTTPRHQPPQPHQPHQPHQPGTKASVPLLSPPPTTAATTTSTVPGQGLLVGFTARRRAIPSDNSCLFNALAYLCDGRKGAARVPSWKPNSPATELRQTVANIVTTQPDKYTAAVLGKAPKDYVDFIQDISKWGGGIELAVLSEHFNVEIVAIDIQTLVPYCNGTSNDTTQSCFVLYNGVHYDAISFASLENASLVGANAIASEELDVTLVDATERQNALDQALDLARQLKQMGSFTDLKKGFKVQCLQCYVKLQGRKECVAHATESGHNQFGEFKG